MVADIYFQLGVRLNEFSYKMPLIEEYLLVLEEIFTQEEAAIAIKMPAKSHFLSELSAMFDMPEKELGNILEQMAYKGTIFSQEKDGKTAYNAIPFVPGIGEYQLMRGKNTPYERKLAVMLDEFENKLNVLMTPEMLTQFPDMVPVPFARAIPINKDIQSLSEIYSYEKVAEIIEREEVFSAAKCYCRHHSSILGRTCKIKDAPEYACMGFGVVAEYTIKYGFSKKITKKQAFDILDQADRAGLVHCTNNVSDLMTFICNCCGCCCAVLRNIVKHRQTLGMTHSNFIITANTEDCTGCGECDDRCQLEALSLEDDIVCIDESRCIGCGICTSTCPVECLQLVRRQEIIEPAKATDPFIGMMEA